MRFATPLLLLASCACQGISASRVRTPPPDTTTVAYEEKFFTQTLDHFRYAVDEKGEPATYQQRYLINTEQWSGKGKLANGCKGPILFYTGNEGPIDAFWGGSGFITNDLAKEWGAMVLFAEFRYYGKSMPFGEKSLQKGYADYCTTEQALADYAALIEAVKKENNAENCPVIAFGGSYGGTLTTFFRLKYPHVVAGGLAASAPFGYYDPEAWAGQGVTPYTWIDIVNKVYRDGGCLNEVESARKLIYATAQNESGRKQLQEELGLCSPPSSADDAVFIFTDAVESLPQLNYPYPVGIAPAWPINATCVAMTNSSVPSLLARVKTFFSYYYQQTGEGCIEAEGLGGIPGGGPTGLGDGGDGWGYQSCTETLHEFSGRGVRDFTFNLTQAQEVCRKAYSVEPRPGWFRTHFGGYLINAKESPLTNVIFSNGLLDPWHGGGMLSQNLTSCPVYIMPNGAHHVDLRGSHPDDTEDIIAVRQKERVLIKQWIDAASRA